MDAHNYANVSLEVFFYLFVAVDPIGIVPIYISLTDSLEESETRRIVWTAILVSFFLGVGFLLLGKYVFNWLGITLSDFKVSGGLLLLLIAIVDLIFENKTRRTPAKDIGIVPIAMPLIVGPATLLGLTIFSETHGFVPTVLSYFAVLLIIFLEFVYSKQIMKLLGPNVIKTMSKVVMILLAAVAFKMMREGIFELLQFYHLA
jgi:multiple antibiotic resistance protein